MHSIHKKTILFALLSSFIFSAHAERFQCANKPYRLGTSSVHEHTKFAPVYPGVGLAQEFRSFYSVIDSSDDDNNDGSPDQTAQPAFVSYHLKGVQPDESGQYYEPSVSINRPRPWYENNRLKRFVSYRRTMDASYHGIGTVWNRGHWMPADHAQRISAEASCNTHTFFNASPQEASLNQGAWRLLENFSAALSNEYTEAWVVTGPIFYDDPIQYIGDEGELKIAVPDALFHITFVQAGTSVLAYPFILPQPHTTDAPPKPTLPYKKCRSYSLSERQELLNKHVTSISTIESYTGLYFLTEFPDEVRAPFIDHVPSIPQPKLNFYDPLIRCFTDD